MKNEVKYVSYDLKFLNENGTFEGYASLFGVTDGGNDEVVKGAFKKSLAEKEKIGRSIPMLWQHETDSPIGKWDEIREDDKGLFVKGTLFTGIQQANEAYILLKENVINGLSIGYRTITSARDTTGKRLLKEIDLLEISIVTFPMLDAARITGVKSAPKTEREFEEFLRDAGYSRTESKGIVAHGFKTAMGRRDADTGLSEIARLTAAIVNATK